MFGYDKITVPVVATNVTPTEAKAFARAKGMTGFFLVPHWSQIEKGGGMIACRWFGEKGDYETWTGVGTTRRAPISKDGTRLSTVPNSSLVVPYLSSPSWVFLGSRLIAAAMASFGVRWLSS